MNKAKVIVRDDLRTFKTEIKGLSFAEKMVVLFSLSPALLDDWKEKEEAILKDLNKDESLKYFSGQYVQIYETAQEYEDRIRTLKGNCDFFNFYITSIIRQRDVCNNITAFLNWGIKEAEKSGSESILKGFKDYKITMPIKIELDEDSGEYKAETSWIEKDVETSTQQLTHVLSGLKTYIESLKEFFGVVEHSELMPLEFEEMEEELLRTYKGGDLFSLDEIRNSTEAVKKFLLLDYKELPLDAEMMGEGNLWTKFYKRLTEI